MRGNAHMEKIKFTELGLLPEMQRAIDELGFEEATDIQAEAIPLIRTGADVIGRSQTGTGKTFAFAIPAIERIDREQAQPTPQVLILCPTRELAQQGCEEIRKLTRFMRNIWPADVYGGASMERQIALLRRANLVIGTPGRVMDHMRRGTLSLQDIRMVVLDEADEMLSMGFREDIETILQDVPESRQTVLFSATMPDAILELTNQFLREPKRIEINRAQVTLDNIRQLWMEIPLGRKPDALVLLLHAYAPKRCMIFVNTKLMADEVAAHLNQSGFTCEAIHGDMNQSQRTRVMEGFKSARLPILVATDVAARGIDVSDVDYVVNYDVPQNSEHYVHRIGRTGRAGREGVAITLSSGRRQFWQMRDIARETKSKVEQAPIPTVAEIRAREDGRALERVQSAILEGVSERHAKLVGDLLERGYDLTMVAAAAFDLAFAGRDDGLKDIAVERRQPAERRQPDRDRGRFRKIQLGAGRKQNVAPNHIVSAVAERAHIRGSLIGKIEIFDDFSVVGVPADRSEEIARSLEGLRLCGHAASVRLLPERGRPQGGHRSEATKENLRGGDWKNRGAAGERSREGWRSWNGGDSRRDWSARRPAAGNAKRAARPSREAKARLLDASDLTRYEIGAGRRPAGAEAK